MKLTLFQKGFNYSQDGPGNRLVYHLFGCNMRCPWCANPEGIYPAPDSPTAVSVEELVAEAVSCRPLFFDGGGVTFTGGEATLQAEALTAALRALRSEHIRTALETNATSAGLPALFPLLDYLIADFKHPDSERPRAVTGIGNDTVRQNLRQAAQSGPPLLVRVPLIGGFNTDEAALRGFADFFETLSGEHTAFELLLYHEYGKDKWARLGIPYTVKDAFVPEATRLRLENMLTQRGLRVVRT